jgi:hypothetical protein
MGHSVYGFGKRDNILGHLIYVFIKRDDDFIGHPVNVNYFGQH